MRSLLLLAALLRSTEAGQFVHARVNENCSDACRGSGGCEHASASADWLVWARSNTAAAFAEAGHSCVNVFLGGKIYSASASAVQLGEATPEEAEDCFTTNSSIPSSCAGHEAGARLLCWCGSANSWAATGGIPPPPAPPWQVEALGESRDSSSGEASSGDHGSGDQGSGGPSPPPPPHPPAQLQSSRTAFYAALLLSGIFLMLAIVICQTRPITSSEAVAALVRGREPVVKKRSEQEILLEL